jgi:hypothetical protein
LFFWYAFEKRHINHKIFANLRTLFILSFPALQPRQGALLVAKIKMAHLGMDKMAGDARQDRQKTAVGHSGDFGNVLVVVFDEFKMGQQGGKVGPAGEGYPTCQPIGIFA